MGQIYLVIDLYLYFLVLKLIVHIIQKHNNQLKTNR